jgi:Ser/Thr protein kinase RdoA (MazF antagonist)
MTNILAEKASEIALEHYGIDAETSKLEGYVDENFLLKTTSGEKFLLKISSEENCGQLDFQVQILKHLSEKELVFNTAEVIPNKEGKVFSKLSGTNNARLLSWLPGRLWATVNPKTEILRYSLGEAAGELTKALQDFEHPGAHRTLEWDLANTAWTADHLGRFNGKRKMWVAHFQKRFDEIKQAFEALPKSIVHNDLNDYNILVPLLSEAFAKGKELDDPKVSGVIDFGDSVYTQTVNDLAIAIAYAIMDLPDPLSASLDVVKGYNAHYKLSEKELECLYVLVGMRLVITVVNASLKKEEFPDDDYFVISEKPAWNLLEKWFAINENFAYYSFRDACGYTAHPLEEKFKNWAKKQLRFHSDHVSHNYFKKSCKPGYVGWKHFARKPFGIQ